MMDQKEVDWMVEDAAMEGYWCEVCAQFALPVIRYFKHPEVSGTSTAFACPACGYMVYPRKRFDQDGKAVTI